MTTTYIENGTTYTQNLTTITDDWKQNNTLITSLTIGDNVTSIGDNAFNGCSNLTTIIWPGRSTSKLKTIGHNAFKDTSITTVILPESVISVGRYAFRSISTLTTAIFHSTGELTLKHEDTSVHPSVTYGRTFSEFTSNLTKIYFTRFNDNKPFNTTEFLKSNTKSSALPCSVAV